MRNWLWIDTLIVVIYGLQHSLLTTKTAVELFNYFIPNYLWNITYSLISLVILVVGFYFWQPSGVYVFRLIPGTLLHHAMTISLALSLFMFFYCFKYTTSFWQWIGIKQVVSRITGSKAPAYYVVRKNGIKRYVRFPHHTCLVFFFWLHPVMTLDTLFLAIAATIYLYVGTAHQDSRGLRLIGKEWEDYRRDTSLLFPSLRVWRRMLSDFSATRQAS